MSAPTSPPPYQPGLPSQPGQPAQPGLPAYDGPRLDVSRTPAVPFARLVAVELRKTVDTVASFWLVAAIAIITLLIDGFVLIATLVQGLEVSLTDFTNLALAASAILLPILGIMLVTSEWSQRTAMVTFSLEPRRIRVVLAKLVVGLILTVITIVVAVVIGIVCTAICELANGPQTTWNLGGKDLIGFLLVQSLAMLGGFALATLLLNTPASIVAYLVYRFALPGVLFVISSTVSGFDKVSPYLNFTEAQGPLADLSLHGIEWAQLFVSGLIWLGLPLGFGLYRILRAEVK